MLLVVSVHQCTELTPLAWLWENQNFKAEVPKKYSANLAIHSVGLNREGSSRRRDETGYLDDVVYRGSLIEKCLGPEPRCCGGVTVDNIYRSGGS